MDPPTRHRAEALLLKAGRAYGVQARREEVQRALDDAEHGPAFAEWAAMHLVSDALLTTDELALYTALDSRGQADRLAALRDLAEVQAVNDDDLRLAIDDLRQSTATLGKQTETLRQQQAALSRLIRSNTDDDARRRDLHLDRQRNAEAQRRQLAAEVDELSHSLGFRLSHLEQQGREAGPHLDQLVGGLLDSDDKLLSSLQKLGWELDQPDANEAQAIERLRETCMRLIKTTVETIRAKLDTAYLDSLVTAERSGCTKPATDDEVKALQEEVESLYSEILPVAQMSVDQQHLEPAIKSVAASSGQSLSRTATALTYVDECLDYLLDRIARIQEHVQLHKSHQTACAALASTASAEMAIDVSSVSGSSGPVAHASPVRRPSPVRIPADTASARGRRRSSSIQEEAPLQLLLRNLVLSAPSLEEGEGKTQVAALTRTLAERSQKVADVARSAQESFEASMMAQLEDARLAIQLLRDSVLAESPFGEAKLVDPDIESSIIVLQQEVGKAREKLKAVASQKPMASSETREHILQRFGTGKY